ncbi:hypothetical protein ABT373_10805 [Streptomyces sp. NPDC000070]|uniref:hypothetical protein n=1 Tax=Streptomyces sp. NPDC000070 TaxID=3154240 RepID=UPI0033260189
MMRLLPTRFGGHGAAAPPDTHAGPEQAADAAPTPAAEPAAQRKPTDPSGPGGGRSRRGVLSRRRGLIAPLLAGLIVLGAGLAVVGQLPAHYSATSTLSFVPRSQSVADADIIELIANKYAVVAGSTRTIDTAADAADVTPKQLRDELSVGVQPTTGNLEIAVSLGKREESAAAANAIATVVDRVADRDRLVSSDVTARADADAATAQPSLSLLRGLVVAAAFLVAGWVAFAMRQIARKGTPSGS